MKYIVVFINRITGAELSEIVIANNDFEAKRIVLNRYASRRVPILIKHVRGEL